MAAATSSRPLPTGSARPDIRTLTTLRGFAAWWVVFYHFKAYFEDEVPSALSAFISQGYLAVDLFFCLSGFVIYLNYRDLSPGDRPGMLRFYIKRLARVYPLHLFMLLAYVGYMLGIVVLRGAHRLDDRFGWDSFVANLFLVQNWGLFADFSWNVPAWSISAEFAAYLAFPFLMALLGIRRASPIRLGLTASACYGAMLIAFSFFEFELGFALVRAGVLRCILQFGLGIICCEMYLRHGTRLAALAPFLTAAGLALFAGTIAWKIPTAWLVPAAWFLLITGVASLRGRVCDLLSAKPLVYLGDISYATYLFHYFAYDVFKALLVEEVGEASWLALAGTWLVILAVSPLLYHLVERPAQRWLTRRLIAGQDRNSARTALPAT